MKLKLSLISIEVPFLNPPVPSFSADMQAGAGIQVLGNEFSKIPLHVNRIVFWMSGHVHHANLAAQL